jgi:hypothetical protein
MFVMVNCSVLFEVRTELLNLIHTSFGFKGLMRQAKPKGPYICRKVLHIKHRLPPSTRARAHTHTHTHTHTTEQLVTM